MQRPWAWELGLGIAAGFLSGVLSTLVVLWLGAFYLNEWIADRVAASTRSCNSPGDLRLLDPAEVELNAEWLGQRANHDLHHPSQLLDNNPGSIWIPPPTEQVDGSVFAPRTPAAGTLHVDFIDVRGDSVTRDVQLVCVVNGLASEPIRYRNWGRVRTVVTRGDGSEESNRTVLASLPDDRIQAQQEVAIDDGKSTGFSLRILDAYSGQTVFTYDGDLCGQETTSGGGWELAYERGCLVGATRKAGLAELDIYVRADS